MSFSVFNSLFFLIKSTSSASHSPCWPSACLHLALNNDSFSSYSWALILLYLSLSLSAKRERLHLSYTVQKVLLLWNKNQVVFFNFNKQETQLILLDQLFQKSSTEYLVLIFFKFVKNDLNMYPFGLWPNEAYFWSQDPLVFCWQNCSHLLWE